MSCSKNVQNMIPLCLYYTMQRFQCDFLIYVQLNNATFSCLLENIIKFHIHIHVLGFFAKGNLCSKHTMISKAHMKPLKKFRP
jgi:hypothetical protein